MARLVHRAIAELGLPRSASTASRSKGEERNETSSGTVASGRRAAAARLGELTTHRREESRIGALEAEDRLLRIADRKDGVPSVEGLPLQNSSVSRDTISH